MPIANCIVAAECVEGVQDLVELWAAESCQTSEHMTVNIIKSHQQYGRQYSVMANLLLPSLWSGKSLSRLQLGLASALAQYFDVTSRQVQVITSIINSELIVEDGKEINENEG